MNNELKQRLVATAGFRSLDFERQITIFIRACEWDATQSFYYIDTDTQKARELDVLGKKIFSFSKRSFGPLARTTHLLVERKAIEDYHLIFSHDMPPAYAESGYFHWLGEQKEKVFEDIYRVAPRGCTARIIKAFNDFAFPNDIHIVNPYMIHPPRSLYYATAFRELKPKSERELETSVLWKTVQSITSAMNILTAHVNKNKFSDIIDCVHPYETQNDEELFEVMMFLCKVHLIELDIFHPIIVMQCPMWSWDGAELTEIQHVRLINRRHGLTNLWYDVVQAANVQDFLQGLIAYYDDNVSQGVPSMTPSRRSIRGGRQQKPD